MDWGGVDYCDVIISCLDSFWRHPFTAEDPLLSKWRNATFLQIFSDEETNSSTSWMASAFVANVHIWVNYLTKKNLMSWFKVKGRFNKKVNKFIIYFGNCINKSHSTRTLHAKHKMTESFVSVLI